MLSRCKGPAERADAPLEPDPRVYELAERGALEQLAGAWDKLAESVARPSPLATYAWFVSQLDENAQLAGKRWRVFAAFIGERLVGVLPLIEERGLVPAFGHGRLRMPGHYYALNSEPLLADATCEIALRALLKAANRWRPGLPVELGGVRSDSPAARALLRARHATRRTEARGTAISVEDSPEDWFDGLPKNLRKHLKRQERRLREQHGEPRLEVIRGPDSARYLEQYAELEARGWKGQAGIALRSSESKMRYYRRFCGMAAERGWLEWHTLSVGETAIAIDMRLNVGNTLFGLFTTYDERFSVFGPRSLLLRRTIEDAHRRPGIARIDGMSAKEWTAHWRMEVYEYYGVLVAAGAFPIWLNRVENAARTIARRSLPGLARSRQRRRLSRRRDVGGEAGAPPRSLVPPRSRARHPA